MADEYRNTDDGCLEWDDTIEDDGQEMIVLPEGDYNFRVTNFERGRFPGGPKLPPCNKASLTLRVKTDKGEASVRTDLLLHKSLEWKISSFFRSIGVKKHGEQLVMDWNHVIGSQGRAHFKPRVYTDKNGDEKQANDVARFLDYDEKYFTGDNTDIDDELDDVPF